MDSGESSGPATSSVPSLANTNTGCGLSLSAAIKMTISRGREVKCCGSYRWSCVSLGVCEGVERAEDKDKGKEEREEAEERDNGAATNGDTETEVASLRMEGEGVRETEGDTEGDRGNSSVGVLLGAGELERDCDWLVRE